MPTLKDQKPPRQWHHSAAWAPRHTYYTHLWQTPRLPWPSLRHAHMLRPETLPPYLMQETSRISTSKEPTTCSLGSTSIGCTKILETKWMAESQRMVSGKLGKKNLHVCIPNAMTHCPENSGKHLSQPSQWLLTLYELQIGTLKGWELFSWSYCSTSKPLITP